MNSKATGLRGRTRKAAPDSDLIVLDDVDNAHKNGVGLEDVVEELLPPTDGAKPSTSGLSSRAAAHQRNSHLDHTLDRGKMASNSHKGKSVASKSGSLSNRSKSRPSPEPDAEPVCTRVEFTACESYFGGLRVQISRISVSHQQVCCQAQKPNDSSGRKVTFLIYENDIESFTFNVMRPPCCVIIGVTSACFRRAKNLGLVDELQPIRGGPTLLVHVTADGTRGFANIEADFGVLVCRLATVCRSTFTPTRIEPAAFLKLLDEARGASDAWNTAREISEREQRKPARSTTTETTLPKAVRVSASEPTQSQSQPPPSVVFTSPPPPTKQQPATRPLPSPSVARDAPLPSDSGSPRPVTRQSTGSIRNGEKKQQQNGVRLFTDGDSLTFPRTGRDSWTLTNSDLLSLSDGEFLNDGIINFYLKRLYHCVLPEQIRQRTHVFNTFFYSRLTQSAQGNASRRSNGVPPAAFYGAAADNAAANLERTLSNDCEVVADPELLNEDVQEEEEPVEAVGAYETMRQKHANVRNWTRNVDIFDKDFILIPINVQAHWLLAIVCFAGCHQSAEDASDAPSSAKRVRVQDKPVASSPAHSVTNLPVIRVVMTSNRTRSKTRQSTPASKPADEATAVDRETSENKAEKQADGEQEGVGELGSSDSQTQLNSVRKLFDQIKRDSEAGSAALDQFAKQYAVDDPAADAPDRNAEQSSSPTSGYEQLPEEIKDSVLYRNKQPCVILFDSLGVHKPKYSVARDIREYLQVEWDMRKATQCGPRTFVSADRNAQITTYIPILPTQNNSFDCGLYLLKYAELFFTKPIKQLVKSPKRPNLRDWFTGANILSMRKLINATIIELYEEEKQLNRDKDKNAAIARS